MHSHEFKFLFEVNESLDASPWVPIRGQWISGCIPMSSSSYSPAYGMNLRLHSHEFKFLFLWISDCIPMNPYSRSMNLRMHSHEFLSYSCESQTAFPWVPIPSQWISGCLSSSSYFPANESQDAFPWVPIPLPNFWSLLVGYHPCPAHPTSGMHIEPQKIAFWRDFGSTPIHTTWIPLKSIVEHFRALLRDFCF